VVPEPVRRPERVAIMLALAHKIQQAIDRGAVHDRAEVARRLGLTRARVTQLLDLTLLAPDIQAWILELQAVDGVEPMSERALRDIVHAENWAVQCERHNGRQHKCPIVSQLPEHRPIHSYVEGHRA
jgi:hypothetical protein